MAEQTSSVTPVAPANVAAWSARDDGSLDSGGQFSGKQEMFLGALIATGFVMQACQRAGVTRNTVYYWRKTNAEFLEAFRWALRAIGDKVVDEIQARAFDRADPASARLLERLATVYADDPAWRPNTKVQHEGDVTYRHILVLRDEAGRLIEPAL